MNNAILYALAVLIWGSTWFAIEFQLGVVQPEVSIVYRYAIATAILFVWIWIRRQRLRFSIQDHVWFALLGILLFGLNYILAYRSQIYITSALAAIMFSTIVWLNIINARLFFGVRPEPRVLLGALLGIVGIVVLFAPQVGEVNFSDGALFGMILAFCGALSASFGNIASQGAQQRQLPVLQTNAWGMAYGTFFSLVIALVAGHPFNFDLSIGYLVSLGYLIVFGSIVAFWAYLTLLGRIGAHKAGYAMVMFPMVALVLSVAFEGLQVTASLLIGVGLVLVGNAFVIKRSATGST
ncbi:MAG: EamA family transporter [Pseudomonadota bacterium]